MNRLLNSSYRRNVDSRINRIIHTHRTAPRAATSLCATRNNMPKLNHNINVQDALYVFKEKWDDLEIPQSAAAEQRFVEQFFISVQNKSLLFGSFGLGPNGIRSLLEVVSTQNKFVFLDLSSNHMLDEGAIHVARYLYSNPPIIHLDLRSNAISIDGFVNLFRSLRRNNQLTSLDVSAVGGIDRNKMGINGCKELARLLVVNETLSHLNASMSGIPVEGLPYLSTAIANNKGLVMLDFSGNRLGSTGATKLFTEDKSLGFIENLNLSRNEITDSAAQMICKQLKMSDSLRSLDLSHNKFSKSFLKRLVQSIQDKNIQYLSLSHNLFDPECGETLQLLVKDVASIQILNLSSNPLHDSAVSQIAKALKNNRSIKLLDLSDTFIGNPSTVKIAKAISQNDVIEKLFLNNNTISDSGASAIAHALENNKSMLILGLQSNEMTDDTAQVFMDMLQKNNTIIDIDVDFNDFTYRSHVHLKQTIAEHKKMLNLNISEYANRHIEKLKEDEKKLFEVRERLSEQTQEVTQSQEEKMKKEHFFEELQKIRTNNTIESDKRLIEVKKEYESIHEERIQFQAKFSDFQLGIEGEKNRADTEYQNISTKRQHAASRLHRAENKKLEAEVQVNRVLDDLKVHFLTIKQQLSQMLKDARREQEELIRQVEAKREMEEAARIAQQIMEKAEVEAVPADKRKVQTLEEMKKLSKKVPRQKKQKKAKKAAETRPKTVTNAPIVRPQFQGDPLS